MHIMRYLRGVSGTLLRDLKLWCLFRRIIRQFKSSQKSGGQIIFIGAPLHGNLGDHAIALAMRAFFCKELPDKSMIEIPGAIFPKYAHVFQQLVRQNDCIAIIGGGFLGTLWLNEEEMVRSAIRAFPENRVVIFPQTVFFDSTEKGAREKAITRKLYRSHKDLHLCVRDYSIRFVQDELCGGHFSDVRSAPDIVLFLDQSAPKFERAGVLLCFRSDKEKVLSETSIPDIESKLSNLGESVTREDTVVPYGVSLDTRESEVEKKLDKFRSSRLVITDRLHGMIFAAITGTPCIALDNTSGKVGGVWSLWLKRLPYIKFLETADKVPELIDEMLTLGSQHYDPFLFQSCWQDLAGVMRIKEL